MRTLFASLCLLVAQTSLAARIEESPFDLAVILNFKGPHSSASVWEMERETGAILKSTGVRLRWSILSKDPPAVYDNLVVITFTGSCEFDLASARSEGIGPYAMTRVGDGRPLPFAEVDCDRVVRSARGAMSSIDYAWADRLVGRAMGRVVAHELVHMLTGSRRHATQGVAQPALSGEELIDESLPLSMLDAYKVKQELKDTGRSFLRVRSKADVRASAAERDNSAPVIDRMHQAN